LALGFAIFFSAFLIYARFLGGIDGLPTLPDDYKPVDVGPELEASLPPLQRNSADAKLQEAFGVNCEELAWPIKMELQSRGMVLAASEMKILDDGTVSLRPFRLAVFGKDHGDPLHRQIDTIKCNEAVLRFDQKVKNIVEMSNRKIVGFTLKDEIHLADNRRTPDPSDDLTVYTQGPLEYEESRHLIWTQAEVSLTDLSNRPNSNTIKGIGMDIFLVPDARLDNSSQGGTQKVRNDAGPVERIVIRSNVDINLWVDAHSSFMGADDEASKNAGLKGGVKNGAVKAGPPTPKPHSDKAKVVLMTQGPFTYDLQKNRAIFHISEISGPKPNVVTVDRWTEGKIDHLHCDHLEIQLSRKQTGQPPASPNEQTDGLEIEDAHATGKEVVIASDAEILEAHGNDFYYDKVHGLSTLKGGPKMWALKEGNLIEAPELQLQSTKGVSQATAIGAGRISILDKKTGKRPLAARWEQKLIYKKEGTEDVLELIGNAGFFDQGEEQGPAPRSLQADGLKVWLLPTEPGTSSGADADEQQRRKPDHLDATGHVTMTAPDMVVHDTDHLTVWFKDVPPLQLPSAPEQPKEKPDTPGPLKEAAPPNDEARIPNGPSSAGPKGQANAPASRKPIDLKARQVVAHVLRTESRHDLDKLWCEGAVQVHQDPSGPDDRGVDILGDTLELNHHVDGNVLAVTANPTNSADPSTCKYAKVQINKISILGSEVNIDQTSNVVEVNGNGIMNMLNKKDFNGADLSKPTDLTISWRKRMYFNGQEAQFWEGVLAEQEGGHLGCEWMQVFLDRVISLREGEKNAGAAKVQKLVCGDKRVWLEDTKQEGSRIVSVRRVDASFLSVDNDPADDTSQADATGPGSVRIFQLGSKGDPLDNPTSPSAAKGPSARKPAGKPANKKDEKPETEFKLTQIYFEGRMSTNNKRGIVTFYDRVAAVHFPTEDPDYKLQPGRLPPGGMALTCGRLEVYSHKQPDSTTTKEMRAYHNVVVEGQGFSGRGDIVKYDESKEQIIFEGLNSPAVLYRQRIPGQRPDSVVGRKITYWRITGTYEADDARQLNLSK
jgi:hypothetical protein